MVPPLILNVKVYGGVAPLPVNVIAGAVLFWHTDVVPEIDADGSGFTTTVAEPDAALLQLTPLDSCTLTKE